MKRPLLLTTLTAISLAAFPAAAGAATADRDHDGMSDRWEQRHRAHSARADLDRDGLRNLTEFRRHTDPRDADTDDDGLRDGREHRFGLDARDRDSDDDGVRDDDEGAGTITSFADGVLTITLAAGGELTGRVDPQRTEIECSAAPTATAAASGPGSDGDDDRNGSDDDDVRDDDDRDDDAPCGATELTAGRLVREAELLVGATGAVFREIELRG